MQSQKNITALSGKSGLTSATAEYRRISAQTDGKKAAAPLIHP